MKIALALAACLFLLVAFPLDAADDLGYVRIENPKSFLGKLDAVTGKLGARVSDDLPLFAQRYLKNPLLGGIEMTRSWTFVFLDPQRHTNHLAIVVGVSDAASFYDSFGKGGVSNVRADPAGATDAVRHFTEVEDVYDHQAYLAAVNAGQKVEPLQFKKQVTKHYYVTVRDGKGMIVDDVKQLDDPALTALAADGNGARGDIVATLRAPAILALYEDELRRQKESILSAIGSAAAGDVVARRVKQLVAEFDATLIFFKNVAKLEIGADFGGGQLKLRIAALPLEGSSFSRALAGQQPRETDAHLLALLPADVAMLGTLRFAPTKEWSDFLLELVRPILEASAGNNSDSSAKLMEACRETMNVSGGAFATAVLAPSTNQTAPDGIEVFRVVDGSRARKAQRMALETGLSIFRAIVQPGNGGEVKYEPDFARCGGVGIDQVTIDPGTPGDAIFGTNCVQQIAFAGGFELVAQGPHCTNNIRRLITAAAASSGADAQGFKAAAASFPKKENGIFYLNLADYIGHLRNTVPAGNDAALRRLQAQLAEAKARVTGYLVLEARAAVLKLSIPLDVLVDIFIKNNAPPPASSTP